MALSEVRLGCAAVPLCPSTSRMVPWAIDRLTSCSALVGSNLLTRPSVSFTESLPSVRAGSRLTMRLRVELGCAVAAQVDVSSELDRYVISRSLTVPPLVTRAGTDGAGPAALRRGDGAVALRQVRW